MKSNLLSSGMKGKVDEQICYHFMMEGVFSGKEPSVMQAWIDYQLPLSANYLLKQADNNFTAQFQIAFLDLPTAQQPRLEGAITLAPSGP